MTLAAIFGPFKGFKPPSANRPAHNRRPIYHRHSSREEAEEVARSGELWGAPPRNIFRSDIPCVKAFAGGLDRGDDGYEFTTGIEPAYASKYERRWVAGSPGVTVENDLAKIPVTVTRIRVGGYERTI